MGDFGGDLLLTNIQLSIWQLFFSFLSNSFKVMKDRRLDSCHFAPQYLDLVKIGVKSTTSVANSGLLIANIDMQFGASGSRARRLQETAGGAV